jgi:hypothetical protein
VTNERFTPSEKFDLNKVLAGGIGPFKGHEDHEIVIELDAWAADDVRGRQLHSSQVLTELPRGGLRVELRLSSLEGVARWILGFEHHAVVISPEALRDPSSRKTSVRANFHVSQTVSPGSPIFFVRSGAPRSTLGSFAGWLNCRNRSHACLLGFVRASSLTGNCTILPSYSNALATCSCRSEIRSRFP